MKVVSASAGLRVGVSCPVSPTFSTISLRFKVISVGCGAVTVTFAVADLPLEAVAVMVTSPFLTPVTTPLATVAVFASDVVQATALSVASVGVTVAVSVTVFPASTVAVEGDIVIFETSLGLTSILQVAE